MERHRQYKVHGQVTLYFERTVTAYDSDDALEFCTDDITDVINQIDGCSYSDNKLVADLQKRMVRDDD